MLSSIWELGNRKKSRESSISKLPFQISKNIGAMISVDLFRTRANHITIEISGISGLDGECQISNQPIFSRQRQSDSVAIERWHVKRVQQISFVGIYARIVTVGIEVSGIKIALPPL